MRPGTATLTAEQREKLLREIWVAHDGRWFVKTVQEVGFDTANKLNQAVIRSLGKAETRRLMAEAKVGPITSTPELKAFLDLACGLYMPEDHRYAIEVLDANSVVGRVSQCYVFKNVSKAGAAGYFRCAAGARFSGWLEGCSLAGEVVADKNTDACNGTCDIVFRIAW